MGLFDLFKKKPNGVRTITNMPARIDASVSMEEHAKKISGEELANTKTLSPSNELPSLEALLKRATPSKGGLYPHEIIMLDYASSFKTFGNSFQSFWRYQYSVENPQTLLTSLHERGFIEPDDLRSVLERLTLAEIREELKPLNEKLAGKKAELIDRLLAEADTEKLSAKYPDRHFRLTPRGEQELKENQYVPYLHRHRYMSVWDVNYELAHQYKGHPYRDVIWGHFNKQSDEHFRNYNFNSYRGIRYSMYEFLMEENKPKSAFELLAEAVFYDLSLMENNMEPLVNGKKDNFYWDMYEMKLAHIAPYGRSFVASPIASNFRNLQSVLELSDDEFKAKLTKAFKDISIPDLFMVFTEDECVQIVMASMKQDTAFLEAIYEKASKRKYSEYKRARE